jgi:hypothetical protein
MIFSMLVASSIADDGVIINVQSDPPLPLKNLVRNGGFEDGFEGWRLPEADSSGKDLWKISLSDNAYQGKHSLHVKVAYDGRNNMRGIYQSFSSFLADKTISKGKSYMISCWLKGRNISTQGATYQGGGVALSFFSKDYKNSEVAYAYSGDTYDAWEKVISKPVLCQDFSAGSQVIAGIAYTAGEVWIDDICVTEASVKLNIHITGAPLVQVLVEDGKGNQGKIFWDSGRLPSDTWNFSKEIDVTGCTEFIISVLDQAGNIVRKRFPEN